MFICWLEKENGVLLPQNPLRILLFFKAALHLHEKVQASQGNVFSMTKLKPMMTQLRHYLGTTNVGQVSHMWKGTLEAVKSTCCFSRGLTFCSQHLCWAIVSQNPQSPVTPRPGTLTQPFIKRGTDTHTDNCFVKAKTQLFFFLFFWEFHICIQLSMFLFIPFSLSRCIHIPTPQLPN